MSSGATASDAVARDWAEETREGAEAYRDFAEWTRPKLARLLRAGGLDLTYVRAAGDYLYARGRDGATIRVLDLVGGFGTTLFGHNHPVLVAALRRALDAELPMTVQGSVRARAGLLAKRLSAACGGPVGRSYVTTFANSGAEAVEAGLKHAELEWCERLEARTRSTRRVIRRLAQQRRDGCDAGLLQAVERELDALERVQPVALALARGFHGKTLGALALTANPAYRLPWKRNVASHFLPFGDVGTLRAIVEKHQRSYTELVENPDGSLSTISRRFSAVMACFAEPVQGEGGVRPMTREFALALREVADEFSFPLVFDEIQSGFGRTGTFLASHRLGVPADYVLLSKALGGGLAKISALLVDRGRYVDDFGYVHTSTFADDDLACTVSLRALDLLQADGARVMQMCAEKGAWLRKRLERLAADYPDVFAPPEGVGLMLGVQFRSEAPCESRFLRVIYKQRLLGLFLSGYFLDEHRIRVLPALSLSSAIRIEPSAFVQYPELERFLSALELVAQRLRSGDLAPLVRFAFQPPAASSPLSEGSGAV